MRERRIVMHVDFDYFYAQCEELRAPELRTRPVCVCVFSDRGQDSGAVATANYVAREYGARSGIPIAFAKRRLAGREDAVFLPVDFDYYTDVSEKAMGIMREYADVFEYVGRDEAYLDVTGRTKGDYSRALRLAQQIKDGVKAGTGLGCSVGVSPNKLLSKIASDHQKPDGLTVVIPEKREQFLDPLKVRDIPGIGGRTEKRLEEMGLGTIPDIRGMDVCALNKEFGRKGGTYIYNAARGIDDEPVRERAARIQYSKIATLRENSKEYDLMRQSVSRLCKEVHALVTENRQMFKSVGIQLIRSDLSSRTKTRMLRNPTASLEELERNASQLLSEALEGRDDTVRRVGVRVSELSDVGGQSDITSYF